MNRAQERAERVAELELALRELRDAVLSEHRRDQMFSLRVRAALARAKALLADTDTT